MARTIQYVSTGYVQIANTDRCDGCRNFRAQERWSSTNFGSVYFIIIVYPDSIVRLYGTLN
jgi:hypothetical protein